MGLPLMPKATAIWLIENTSLTFEQIADFCGLHVLEVESLADGDMDSKMKGFDPIISSQLTLDEIKRCEKDAGLKLQLKSSRYFMEEKPSHLKKYTPKAKRQSKPDAVAWMLKYYPNVDERDVCDLIGTTKAVVKAIRNKTYKNMSTLNPRSPAALGLCSDAELDFVIAKSTRS
ncbi:MAG: DUF1013 domain-containing protein [Holosporales bacterium]|jgi:hypothetical protein|nr:DUF1013 domain-containing protein [Holosporales bacterium]